MNSMRHYQVLSAFVGITVLLGLSPLQAHGRDQASMSALMGQLTPEYVKAITNKDEVLKRLLIETFEADWAKAKECLLFDRWPLSKSVKPPSHAAGLLLMGELVRMRSVVCNQIAMATQLSIIQKLQQERLTDPNPIFLERMDTEFRTEVAQGTAEQHFKPLTPTGAEKLTSDIDVASAGLNTEIAVRVFNETFREKLSVPWDPATVFDYNVYAADWIFQDNFIKSLPNTITPRPEHILQMDAGAMATLDSGLQTDRTEIFKKAGLLHIRRNSSLAEWEAYTQKWAQQLPQNEGSLLIPQLQAVNLQFNAFSALVADKMGQIRPAQRPASVWPEPDYFDEAVKTRASNELYQALLLKVKSLRLQYKVLKAKTTKSDADQQQMYARAKQITQALTDAIYFANEVYATEGATLHATQAIQKVAKAQLEGKTLVVILTPSHYLQSFYENVGDALHSLNHYSSDPTYAAYRAGKYIERMILAGRILTSGAPNLLLAQTDYPKLQILADKAARIKAGDDGDDPVKIEALFNQDYRTPADLALLRTAILTFGAELSGKIRG